MIDSTRQAIMQHAIAEFPRECCGLIIVVNGKERYYPCKNLAATPYEHFVMCPRDRAKAEDLGDVIAVVHSHPNTTAEPSEADRAQCETWKLPWYIFAVRVLESSGQVGLHDIAHLEPCGYEAPLVGRSFSHGILDCYTLVQDYYRRELGIDLPYFDRRDGWWDEGEDLYMANFASCGFAPIPEGSQPQIGDIILMQLRAKVPNHAGVYIGNGQMLHHVMRRLSSRDLYDGHWQEITRTIIRYKGLAS